MNDGKVYREGMGEKTKTKGITVQGCWHQENVLTIVCG